MAKNRLSPDELSYHLFLVQQLTNAQTAWASWAQHLHHKYDLGIDGNVDEAGVITRAPSHPDTL